MKLPFLRGKVSAPCDDILALGGVDPFFTERLKALRTKVDYRIDTLKCRVVAVTSAIAGEGKTFLSGNLAAQLAGAGRKKVLLIDADLRKSNLARGMKVASLPGLSEFFMGSAGRVDIIRNSRRPGLHIIPAGTAVTTGAELLSGDRFRSFLSDIREAFDVILLDTPPVLPVADTLGLREQVDGFIFVYRAGFTPHAMLKQAVEEIGEKKVLGVIINGVEPESQRYYSKYYGQYYQGQRPKGDRGS